METDKTLEPTVRGSTGASKYPRNLLILLGDIHPEKVVSFLSILARQVDPSATTAPSPSDLFSCVCASAGSSLLATCLGRLGMSLQECVSMITRLRPKVEDSSGKIYFPYSHADISTKVAETLRTSVRGIDEHFVRDGYFGKDGRCETLVWRPRTNPSTPVGPLASFCSASGESGEGDHEIKVSEVLAAATGDSSTLMLNNDGNPLPVILRAIQSAKSSTEFTCIILKQDEGKAGMAAEASYQRAKQEFESFECFFFDELRNGFSVNGTSIIDAATALKRGV